MSYRLVLWQSEQRPLLYPFLNLHVTLDENEGWKHPNTHKDAMVSAIAKSICWPANV